jgi:hypothetical protein
MESKRKIGKEKNKKKKRTLDTRPAIGNILEQSKIWRGLGQKMTCSEEKIRGLLKAGLILIVQLNPAPARHQRLLQTRHSTMPI